MSISELETSWAATANERHYLRWEPDLALFLWRAALAERLRMAFAQ